MNNPEYVKIGDKKYKINTDFRVAIECNDIAQDDSIKDIERPLAIIYKLFGDEGIDNPQDWDKLLELGIKYLSLSKDSSGVDNNTEIDMDFSEDMDFIETSFISDYKIKKNDVQDVIVLNLKYGQHKERVITGLKRISKPGLRVYAKTNEIPKVLNGLGIAIVSTSKGLMTDKEARKEQLGGEVLAYIW